MRTVDKEEDRPADSLPAYLATPPTGDPPDPPVHTRRQTLPIGELSWPNFERLCVRLLGIDGSIEEVRLFGLPGEDQGGIDFLARGIDGALEVYQCRRVKQMGPAKIRAAVDDFCSGPWFDSAQSFGICTTTNLRSRARAKEIDRQRDRLSAEGKKLKVLDLESLSEELKTSPALVDDFFSRAWVKLFNGEEAADGLGNHLDFATAASTRSDLRRFYNEVFQVSDAGLGLAPVGAEVPNDLRDLFVAPHLTEDIEIAPRLAADDGSAERSVSGGEEERSDEDGGSAGSTTQVRVALEAWLAPQQRVVVSGIPGSGKSSLLRFLALDLLSDNPQLPDLAWSWDTAIPIWIPFGRWTELIKEGGGRSLPALLHTWLDDLGRPDLLGAYEQALEDRRAVLLVDGLDEWKTEGSARLALNLLRIFINERGLRMVATARPNAFRELGPPPGDWATGRLAGLDRKQQLEVVRKLSLWAGSGANAGKIATIRGTPEQFIEELSRAADLRELATAPLTLVFLYWIRARDARLPRDRFDAYRALLNLLLAEYPARRSAAATMQGQRPPIDEEDMRVALAALAFSIHQNGGRDVAYDTAIGTLRDNLSDDCEGPGLDRPRALQASRELLRDASERTGLLFEAGPKRFAFLHRSIQEHLSAVHLSRLALSAQLQFVDANGSDPRWSEVILNLIYVTNRPPEVDELVGSLRKARIADGRLDGDPLMAEIGIGRFGCTKRLSRELVEESAAACETFARPATAEAIALRLLEGLESRTVDPELHNRIRSWVRPQSWGREGLLRGLASWPADPEVDRIIERAMFSDRAKDAKAACAAYRERRKRDQQGPGFLLDALAMALPVDARAAMLEALAEGWPEDPRTLAEIEHARSAECPTLQLVSIGAAVEAGRADNRDLETLISLAGDDSQVGYDWDPKLFETLIAGWPGNPRLKQACLADVRESSRSLQYGLAITVLLSAFPQDPDVARYCIQQLRQEQFPFLSGHHEAWKAVARNFSDIPEVVEAADWWLSQQEHHDPEVSFAALVGTTETGKKYLIKAVEESSLPFWAARALLDGWGLGDADVRAVLEKVAKGDNDQAAMIGHLLPEILGRTPACGRRLLELLADDSIPRADLVLRGVQELALPEVVPKAVDLALPRLRHRSLMGFDYLGVLIELMPRHEQVRKLALQSLSERDPPQWALANGYFDDPEIKTILLELAAPLGSGARMKCWEHLLTLGTGAETLGEVASQYPAEEDPAVATLMARVSSQAAAHCQERDEATAVAIKELRTGDPRWETHAQAALAALLELGRLDAFVPVRFAGGDQKAFSVPLTDRLTSNIPLAAALVDAWDEFTEILGPDYPERFAGINGNSHELFWDVISTVAERNPKSRAALIAHLRRGGPVTKNTLGFLSRTQPRSDGLRDACLQVLGGGGAGIEAVPAAYEILAEQFGGDDDLGSRLLEEFKKSLHHSYFVAVCEAWPVKGLEALKVARESGVRLAHEDLLRVHIAVGETTKAVRALQGLLEAGWRRFHRFTRAPIRSITRRITEDPELSSALRQSLNDPAVGPSAYASYSRLLAISGGLDDSLRRQLETKITEGPGTDLGIDLVAGGARPISHSIADALELSD